MKPFVCRLLPNRIPVLVLEFEVIGHRIHAVCVNTEGRLRQVDLADLEVEAPGEGWPTNYPFVRSRERIKVPA